MNKEKKEEKLYQEFENILEDEGDGKKMQEFLAKNFSELDKKSQNKIIFTLFSQSLNKIASNYQAAAKVVDMFGKLDGLEKDIKDKINILDVKNKIKSI